MGSGCDTVDTADASDTRERWFESSQWPLLLNNYLQSTACRKDEIKEKAAGNWQFKNKVFETNIWKWVIEQSETLKRKKKTPKREIGKYFGHFPSNRTRWIVEIVKGDNFEIIHHFKMSNFTSIHLLLQFITSSMIYLSAGHAAAVEIKDKGTVFVIEVSKISRY